MGIRILVEGLDFAGKTCLVEGLQQRFQEQGLWSRSSRYSLCPDNPVTPLALASLENTERNPLESSSLFLASHLWDLRHLKDFPGVHLQDSCWLRAKAYDRRQGNALPWHQLPNIDFDLVFFMTASIPVRQWRCRQREKRSGNMPANDRWVVEGVDQFLALEHHLRAELSALPNFVELDTTRASSQEVLEMAWSQCQQRFQLNDLETVMCQGS